MAKQATSAKHDACYDVVVLGGGPAGCLAAIHLARNHRRVCLLDRAGAAQARPCFGWLNQLGFDLLSQYKIKPDELGGRPIKSVVFLNADLSKRAVPKLARPVGTIIDRARLCATLAERAGKAGVHVLSPCTAAELRLTERGAQVQAEGRPTIEARFLVLATGPDRSLLGSLGHGLEPASVNGSAAIVGAKTDPAAPPDGCLTVVLGLDRQGGSGMTFQCDSDLAVWIHSQSPPKDVIPNLVTLCRRLHDNRIIPIELAGQAAATKVHPVASASALSVESHVGKHSLVIGEAGGFVASATGEGIYPGMWSAQIAAACIHEALDSQCPQDVLMQFDVRWRMEMADYLRAPNTETHYIIPLVFTNQPMADRMAASLFQGENI